MLHRGRETSRASVGFMRMEGQKGRDLWGPGFFWRSRTDKLTQHTSHFPLGDPCQLLKLTEEAGKLKQEALRCSVESWDAKTMKIKVKVLP